MLGEVPCEDVVGPRLPRLSDKGRAVGKGGAPPSRCSHRPFPAGLAPDFPWLLDRAWLDLGFQKGLGDWGAQNLDRFQPLLEGSATDPARGLAPTVRLGKADLGFQKGLRNRGAQKE